ncbi:MAG: hypothetical protein QMD46_05345 [Methanomicrobiales archaeon]|nr:hypothetical protein [Methanomicrobiales archaeon]MDI6875568.1 hypothetical protein [Methanomicrobiales archaeon]
MEKLNDEGQWIILIAFLVSVAIFFLALVLNQSTVIGQTTAEGVLEFPKNDIQDLRDEILSIEDRWSVLSSSDKQRIIEDIVLLAQHRKNAIVDFQIGPEVWISGTRYNTVKIHYNNGVTVFDETLYH